MPAVFIISGLIFAVFGFYLLRLPKSQRTLANLTLSLVIFTTGLFILLSGVFLLIIS